MSHSHPAIFLRVSRLSRLLLIFVALVMVAGCSSSSGKTKISSYDAAYSRDRSQATGRDAAALAKSYIGAPYCYGGESPAEGFDCSGLVHYIFGRLGVPLPRTAREQAQAGRSVPLSATRPGDVHFFRPEHKGWHAGVATAPDLFVHSPKSGDTVHESPLSRYWRRFYVGTRRYLPP